MPSSAPTPALAIYTLSYTTLFRSPRWTEAAGRLRQTGPGRSGAIVRGPAPAHGRPVARLHGAAARAGARRLSPQRKRQGRPLQAAQDRKSTRLNSSHITISYAVFCSHARPRHLHSFLHDALPISALDRSSWSPTSDWTRTVRSHRPRTCACTWPTGCPASWCRRTCWCSTPFPSTQAARSTAPGCPRSEEHTSELQSHHDLVCRLLLPRPPSPSTLFPTRRSSDLRAGQKQLVAYVRLDQDGPEPSSADLRLHMADRLPGFMVPPHVLVLDAFPLNASGKVDRSRLPKIGRAHV